MIRAGQNIWERWKHTRISEKIIFAVLLAGTVITLIPMLVIARYNVPCTDDYSNGLLTHLAWERSHSFLDVLGQSAQHVKKYYFGWSGLYSVMFMSSLQPAVFGEEWYPLTTYIMLIALYGGIVCLLGAVFRRVLHAAWYQTGIVILIVSAVCTQLLPAPAQSFYWYSGSVNYTFSFGISLVLYAKILTYIRLSDTALPPAKRVLRLVSLSVLSVFIAGTNYVTALTTAILYGCVLILALARKKYSCLSLLLPFCAFAAGFVVSVSAPGNSVRQALFPDHPSAPASIFLSFEAAVKYAHRWLTPSLFFLVIFLVPLLYRIAAKTRYSYSHPLLVLSGSFCLFASMFCPTIYSMGNEGPERLLNIVYFAFVILLVLDLTYILGWCGRTAEKHGVRTDAEEQKPGGGRPAFSAAFLLVILVLFLAGSRLSESQYTSTSALWELRQGEASAYYDEAMARLELLRDDSQQDVVLPMYSVRPWILYFDDMSTDPADWRNIAASRYYEKNSVVLEPWG